MATGGLYGNSSESVGLYGNTTVFGGTYFEWLIFKDSVTVPATPTGGLWDFTTNLGTPPTGWSNTPPASPSYKVYVSIALVNSKSTSTLTWSVPGQFTSPAGTGSVTNVSALTLGTTGTDVSSTVANSTTTPVITLNLPTASSTNRGLLSAADWTRFNSSGSGTVTSVSATLPVLSSGGTTPTISMAAASASVNGYLTSTDWTTFNSKQPAGSYLTSGGSLGTPSGGTLTNLTGLPLTTGVTGILPVLNGGTGTATPGLIQGTNVTITGTWPNQTINSSGGGGSGTVSNIATGTGLTGGPITTTGTIALANTTVVAGTYTAANITIDAQGRITAAANGSGGGGGTVTSVAVSGGTTGLTTSGGPISTAGTITLAGTLAVANGGTGVTASTGANSVVLRDANVNISVNSISEGYVNVAAAGTTTVLTVSSAPNYVVTGSGGQTYQLPDATTLVNGINYVFNNNQSSGTIVVKNNSSTTVTTIQAGGYVEVILLSNATSAGSWDVHNQAPSNVSWSTNTFDYAGSITSATWNGTTVAVNRGGTGQTTYTDGQLLIGNSTGNTLTKATLTAGTGVTITNGSGAITINATGTGGTVTSVAALTLGTTGTDVSSTVATGTTTPVITLNLPSSSATNRGLLTAADWTTFNNKGTVTSVTGTSPVVSSGGATPAISLAASYGDTQNPFASKTANYVLAAPNGTAGAPTFRAIVAADIPTLNQNTTGTAANVTGTVAIANGGTGQTTAAAAFNALAPLTTTGDIVYEASAGTAARLPIGTTGQVLSVVAGVPAWATSSGSGTVTSITAGTGLTGGTITTSGTVALATTTVTAGSYTSSNITVDAYGRITAAANGSGGGSSAYTRTSFTATAGQTAFTVTYAVGYLQVYVNGVLLATSDYTATSGTGFTLTTGANVGDVVDALVITTSVTGVTTGKSIAMAMIFGY